LIVLPSKFVYPPSSRKFNPDEIGKSLGFVIQSPRFKYYF
jgi:hypothetical protein